MPATSSSRAASSRGRVYALPQSPQQLKQLLMVAGIDRYFQIARCFRDEDLRGDRQPEFTQLDLEMSFVDEATVMGFVEAMAIAVSRAIVPDRPIQQVPFPVLTYDEAIERFGSDKPDLRFGMELVDLGAGLVGSDGAPDSGFARVRRGLGSGGRVKAIVAPGHGRDDPPRDRRADRPAPTVRREGPRPPRGRATAASPGADRQVPVGDDRARASSSDAGGGRGDLVLIVADAPDVTADVLGRLRVELGERLGLADPTVLAYVWVHRFPMYQWDAESGRWDATHNPFSGVVPEDEALLVTASGDLDAAVAGRPGRPSPGAAVRPRAQRLGARRRLGPDPSPRPARAQLRAPGPHARGACSEKFGAVLEAFEYGPPPHGGIALGIDRWAALLAHQTNIREVMAFPKTQSGSDLMLEAPSPPTRPVRRARAARSSACPSRPTPEAAGAGERTRSRRLTRFARGLPPCSGRCASPSPASSISCPTSRPSTGTVFRCLFGLPILVAGRLARAEPLRDRCRRRTVRDRRSPGSSSPAT